jgi:signal transduction histidine kinase
MPSSGIFDSPTDREPSAASRANRILQLSFELASASTPAQVSDAAMSGTKTAFPDSVGTIIARRRKDEDELEIFAVSDLPGQVFEDWQRFPIDSDAPMAEVVRTGEVIALESPQAWSRRYPQLTSLLNQTGHRAQLISPLIVGGVTVGALGIAFDKPKAFSTDDIQIATAIASQCAIALERARLFDQEREARAAAESASRAKSEFLASLSHELRTPMNAIGGYVQLIEMGVHGPVTEEQIGALRRISGIQRHVNVLIGSVLEFSRVEAGAVSYACRPVALEACIEECESLTAPQMGDRNLRYQRVGEPASVSLVSNEDKLRQILVNLLTNAIKYTPPNGSVTLSVEAGEEHVDIKVSDTGRGIDPDELDLIFQPFVRLKSSGSIQDGAGLGLPISRSLARGMGGELTAANNPEGGTTFTLALPLSNN